MPVGASETECHHETPEPKESHFCPNAFIPNPFESRLGLLCVWFVDHYNWLFGVISPAEVERRNGEPRFLFVAIPGSCKRVICCCTRRAPIVSVMSSNEAGSIAVLP